MLLLEAVCILLLNGRADAQPVPGTVAGEQLVIGASTASDLNTTAVAKILGVGARTAGQDVVSFNGSNELVRGPLGTADIPSVFTRRDVAETVASIWNFSGGLTVGGNLTGASGTLSIASPTRFTGTAPEAQWNETDQGTSLKNWRAIVSGSQYAVQALDDSYASLGDLVRGYRRTSADLYGGVGSPVTLEIGQYVRNLLPGRNNTLIFGSPTTKLGGLFVSEMIADVFTVIEKQVVGNGSTRWGRGTTLTRDLSSGATTIYVKDRVFRYHDFGFIQTLGPTGQPQFEVLRIVQAGGYDCTGGTTPLPSACGGVDNDDYAISVERNHDQGGANAWVSGDGISATDRYADIYAWQSAIITGGGAIMGDRPHAYWNFNDVSTTQVNRAAESGGTITALNSTHASSTGGFAGDGGSWERNGLSDAQAFSANIASINTGTAGGTEIACSMSIELVYYVNGTTPGSANSQRPVAKWDGSSTSTVTFLIEHWGSAAGGSFNGKMALLGTPVANPITILTPLITPSAGWHHIVFTYSNVNGGRAYVDGVLTGTPTTPVASNACMVTNSNNVTGELWGNNGNAFAAHISELAIYASELSDEQVAAHYAAFQTNRPGLSAGPTIAGYERTSDTLWYGVSERWACGNLVGVYGFQQVTYGCAWGDSTGTWASSTASDGFSIWHAGTRKLQFDTSGNGFLAGSLAVTNNITVGQAGAIMSGATAYDTGEGYWLDCNFTSGACDPRFRIGTTSAGTSYLRWTGSAIDMKSNTLTIDGNGILMASNTTASYTAPYGYRFGTGLSNSSFALGSYEDGSNRQISLVNTTSTASGRAMYIILQVGQNASNANVSAFNDNTGNVGVTIASPNASFHVINQSMSVSGITSMTINGVGLGFSGTKVAGACTFTFLHGWVTNVTGC